MLQNKSVLNFEKILASKKIDDGKIKYLIKMKNEPIERCKWIVEEENLVIPNILKQNFDKNKMPPVVIKQIRGRGRPIKFLDKNEELLNLKPKFKPIIKDDFFENTLNKKRGRPKKISSIEETGVSDQYQEESETSVKSKEETYKKEDKEKNRTNILNEQIDYPEKIKEVKLINNSMCYLIEWRIRNDGVAPEECWVPCSIFKKRYSEYMKQFENIKI